MNRADLKEQMQENLLTYFDAIALGTQAQHTEAMDGMCDIVIKTINGHEFSMSVYQVAPRNV
jgi:hypothetical protein